MKKTKNEGIWTTKDKSAFRRSKEWKEHTIKMKELRGNKCEICGNTNVKKLVVHHRHMSDSKASYTNLDPERFMVLCQLCHKYVHRLAAMYNRKKNPPDCPDSHLKSLIERTVIFDLTK